MYRTNTTAPSGFSKNGNLMKRTGILTAVTALSILIVISCTHRAYKEERPGSEQLLEAGAAARANNNFAFDLMGNIAKDGENLIFSPFSISTAMAMTYAGARGLTSEEMADVLYFKRELDDFNRAYGSYLDLVSKMAGEDLSLNLANSIWAQQDYTFLDSYFETIEKYYNSTSFLVDFVNNRENVRLQINDWVYNETEEKISDLLEPGVLTTDTRMVLANAIHFKGSWLKEFDKDRTTEGDFFTANDRSVKADFMNRNDTIPYYEDDILQAISLPYADGGFSMLFVLPAEGFSTTDLLQDFNADYFKELLSNMEKTETSIHIPVFEIENKMELDRVLPEMGIRQAFSNNADFSGITGSLDLKIDKIIHQAIIEVSEEGTEAAAATAVVIIRKSLLENDSRKVFRANRPFLYFLIDNELNSILFAGITSNPAKGGN